MLKKTLFGLAVISFIPPAFADIYKWRDDYGRTHYSDVTPVVDIAASASRQAKNFDPKDSAASLGPMPENSVTADAIASTRSSLSVEDAKIHNNR